MIFRRRRERAQAVGQAEAADGAGGADGPRSGDEGARAGDRRGPWDEAEGRHTDDPTYVDLGALVVRARSGLELRLSSDSDTGQVVAVMLGAADGAVELRVFAAPRSTGIWDDVRADIAAEVKRVGGSVREQEGEFGTELAVVLPVTLDDGRKATQPSRIVGVQGPRWLLRGTFLGRPAAQADPDGLVESAFRDVVVVRGSEPMAPREALALRLPADAQPYHAAPE